MDPNTDAMNHSIPDVSSPHTAEAAAARTWLRENAVSLVVTAIAIGLVGYFDPNPLDTLMVVIGLGLVVFIHELGHFVAAKWCDVHVKTFSIGFGPAVPFCSYKWGETTYMVGIIPLGGYVSMVGEGDAAADDDAEEDPRSFKNKTVGQRMLIISSGVVMNVLLGMGCFIAAYLHGVKEKPAVVGTVESGSAAWRAGIRSGDEIKQIGSRKNPFFGELRPIVMSTLKEEKLPVTIAGHGKTESMSVEPLRDEGVPFPQLGVSEPLRLTLLTVPKRQSFKPAIPGSPAAEADPPFESGDRIVGMTNPAKRDQVTPLPLDSEGNPSFEEYYRRMVLLAADPISFAVLRKGQPVTSSPVTIVVKPAYRYDLGVRMQMGKIVAVRRDSPAAKAGVIAGSINGNQVTGDVLVAVGVVSPGGKKLWFASGGNPAEAKPGDEVRPLDPMLLPLELERVVDRDGVKIELVVLREQEHKPTRQSLLMDYDRDYRFDREANNLANSPLPVPGLGLAYWVEPVVQEVIPDSPAAGVLQPHDQVTAVRLKSREESGAVKTGEWEELKEHQWASTEAAFQRSPPHEIDLRIKRGDQVQEVTLTGRENKSWPLPDRGLMFDNDTRIQQAGDISEAVTLGARRTGRFIKEVLMNLYAMVFGRISPKTISGPLTIYSVAHRFAGEDFWQFLLFLGMISVNLAVFNFLPIPVLDGGHVVFLILEKILGRPVPEKLFAAAMYVGLALILSLMAFVLFQDVRRVVFGW